jgi:hypothetical protein
MEACPWHMESRVFQFPGVHGRSRSLVPLSRRRLMRQAHGSPALALSASLLFPLRNICSRTWTLNKLCTSKCPLPLSFFLCEPMGIHTAHRNTSRTRHTRCSLAVVPALPSPAVIPSQCWSLPPLPPKLHPGLPPSFSSSRWR